MPCYEPNSDTSSATTLSEDTRQIVSFWHRYLSQRRLQGASSESQNSTAALVNDYLAGIPRSAGANNSETISEGSFSAGSDHGYPRTPLDDRTSWASALAVALLVLTASLLLGAVSLSVYNIQLASTGFGTNAEADTKKPEADTGRPSLMAARAFETGQRLPPKEPGVTTRTSRRTRSESADAVARHEVTTRSAATPVRDELSTGNEEISEAKLLCGSVFYTYCARSTPKFYYDPWEKVCTASRGSNAAVCLKGSNRFPSKRACERSCIFSERRPHRCEDATTFASCTRLDYKGSSLWYFNGRTCRMWEFPAGKCPSRADGAVLFRSYRQCDRKCGTRNGVHPRTRYLACRVPGSARCRPDELKYTYFAVKSATRTRCLPISAPALVRRRCLSGANLFSTRASCERICVPRTHHAPVEYDGDGI